MQCKSNIRIHKNRRFLAVTIVLSIWNHSALGTLEDDQQYFGDILIAIKQVMSTHLEEVQEKFQSRFEKLEDEIKRRDDIINQLRLHISELEKAAEESLTVIRFNSL